MSNRRLLKEAARVNDERLRVMTDLQHVASMPRGASEYNDLRRLGLARREWRGRVFGWRWVLTAKGLAALEYPKTMTTT